MNLKKILPPIIIGNMFEWYDFSLYGYMAPIISKLFFPNITSSLGLIATFTVFLTGFIARPIGSMVFGFYADKLGRKTTLSISILLMALSTSLIGFLPTYTSIGIFASLLLTFCRIIQGFAIGGEFTLSVTYLIEHAPENKKGLFGSCTMLGTFIGLFLGSISVAILNLLFSEVQLTEYGWRIPFILSLFLGLIGLVMRSKLPETPEFTQMVDKGLILENPVKFAIQKSYINLLTAVGLVCLGACSFSMWFIWLPSYLKLYSKLSSGSILLINSSNLFIIIAAIPLIGFLSDKVGFKVILASAALGTIAFVLPLLYFMASLSIYSVWLSQLGLAILASMAYSVIPIALFKLFPAKIRCSGISISYNIANMLFGGTIPLLASLILAKAGNLIYQSIPIIIVALIMLGLLPFIKKNA